MSADPDDGSGGVALQTFADYALVDITVSGLITQHNIGSGVDLQYGPRGLPGCQSGGYTIVYDGVLALAPFPCNAQNFADPVATGRAVVRGPGHAGRSAGPSCPGCFVYSGSQTVTVTEVPVDVQVRSDFSQSPAGSQVTFTSTINPPEMSFGGWWFFMDNGFTYQACPSNNRATCTIQLFGPGRLEIYANYGPLARSASVRVDVGPPIPTDTSGGGGGGGGGGAPTLRIVSAAGPNPGGSFIVRAPENVVQLRAEISDPSLASAVQWEITDDPSDLLVSTPPASVAPGLSTSFTIPSSNIRRDRWPSRAVDHIIGPDRLRRKSLAFRVVAKVDFQGQVIRSEPVVVRQDEIDTLREEYVEWGPAQVPVRAQVGTQGAASRNTGDYAVWPANEMLVERMPIMQQLAIAAWDRPLTVSGGYRNPVHHMIHAGIANPVTNSQHLYGAATDWSLIGPPMQSSARQYFYAIGRLTKDARVGGCFEPEADIRRGAGGQLSHAHSDWRGRCPDLW